MFLTFLCLPQQALFAQEGTQKWVFDTGGGIFSSPAIGDEGIIYVGSGDDHLYAIQPDGTQKWRFNTGGNVNQPPAVADDGTIYVGTSDGKVVALNPDGSVQWTFNSGIDNDVTGPMAVAADGTIYASIGGSNLSMVFALHPDGSQYWSFDPPATTYGISIGEDGVVLFGDAGGVLTALNPNGSKKWDVDVGPGIADVPAFAEDGTIYVTSGATTDNVTAVNPDGTIKWQVTVGRISNAVSTGVNGDVYVPMGHSATSGALVALNPVDGSEKWRFDVANRVKTTPAVGFDGTIYFGSDTDEFYAISPTGTLRWVFQVGQNIQSSPTIAPDGTVYFGSHDSNFYALRSSSSGLAASSWPKLQRDVRNTGQFGSDVTRRRWFAPHVFWLDDENQAVVTIRHLGGSAGGAMGTTAAFRIDLLNRDGSVNFSVNESIEPGATKDIVLTAPDSSVWVGAAMLDSSVRDGTFLAPFLTWQLDVKGMPAPLQIGAFFSDPTDAALVHHFPAEASNRNGLGIAVQNIGDNEIQCSLEFFNADGSMQAEETLDLAPLGSVVDFFNSSLPNGFKGSATFSCDAPVVVVAVNQDFSNGNFPTDRITIKGQK
jgi:outer membrane protein assembly factor BamB